MDKFKGTKIVETQEAPVITDLTGDIHKQDIAKLKTPVEVNFNCKPENLKAFMYFRTALKVLQAKKSHGEEKSKAKSSDDDSVYNNAVLDSKEDAKKLCRRMEEKFDKEYVVQIAWNGDLSEGRMGRPIGFVAREKHPMV